MLIRSQAGREIITRKNILKERVKHVRYWIEWLLVSFFGRLVHALPHHGRAKNRGRRWIFGILGRFEGPGGRSCQS